MSEWRSVRFEYVARHEGEVAFSGFDQRICLSRDDHGPMELPEELRRAVAGYVDE